MAGKSGVRSGDYLVKINGRDVLHLTHEETKGEIARGGDKLSMVVERSVYLNRANSM